MNPPVINRRAVSILALLLGLAACGWLPGADCRDEALGCQVWVAVYPPSTGQGVDTSSLELDGMAWPIDPNGGGGVAMLEAEAPLQVRYFRVRDCRLLAGFTAQPGSAHAIRIGPSGEVSVEDRAGTAMEFGPGLVAGDPSGCV